MRSADSERDLLTLAARAPSAGRDHALATALSTALDWERLLDLTYKHGCVSLLADTLSVASRRDAVPAPILGRLTALMAALSLRCQATLSACASILDMLAARGIQPVLLKGPALATTLYPRPDQRPFQDIDLLLRSPAEAGAAGTALRELGYTRCQQDSTEMEGFHTVYVLPSRSVTVELHTNLLQLGLPLRGDSAVWRSCETIRVEGRQVYILSLEWQILHLCVHLHTHGYGRLIWLKDLDILVRERGDLIAWGDVWRLAEEEGVSLSVRHALATVRDLLGTPLPPVSFRWMPRDLPGEIAHGLLWPRQRVLALRGKQRLRAVRFNPRLGVMGVIPSLVVMGRRREKLRAWLGRSGVSRPRLLHMSRLYSPHK